MDERLGVAALLATVSIFPLVFGIALWWIRRGYKQAYEQQLRKNGPQRNEYEKSVNYWVDNIATITTPMTNAFISFVFLLGMSVCCVLKYLFESVVR